MSGGSVAAYMEKANSSKNAGQTEKCLLGLPLEIQDAIIANASVRARFRLQRVSQHFHDRASRVIWRKLQFRLCPAVYPALKFPEMRMIEALRTVSTSLRDYAQYIHTFDVEVVPDDGIQGSNNEALVAHRYLPESDAQKLLSLSLYLLLRGATQLETFRWQAPVELDASCWKLLAKSTSLRTLLVHLDARSTVHTGRQPTVTLPVTNLPYQHISGCTSLSRLTLARIDDMNHLDHIAACIRGSAGTLKSLQITFSSSLASKARKAASSNLIPPPPPVQLDIDLDASSDEEDDLTPPTETTPQEDPGMIKQHRNLQENALARILSVDLDDSSRKVERVLVDAMQVAVSTESKIDAEGVKSMHGLVDKILAGDKLDTVEARTLEQLRTKLNSASVSRSPKRQKPSSHKKVKSKAPKSSAALQAAYTASQQAYGPAYSVPKSSTSSASNPWANPYPAGSTAPPVFSPSGYTNSNPFSPLPITYSAVLPALHSTQTPTSDYINHADSAHLLPFGDNQATFSEEEIGSYVTMPGGSSGKEKIHMLEDWIQLGSGFGVGDKKMEAYFKLVQVMKKFQNDAQVLDILFAEFKKLTAHKGPPPPPGFGTLSTNSQKYLAAKKAKEKAKYTVFPEEESECSSSSDSPTEENGSGSTSTPLEKNTIEKIKPIDYDDMGVDIVHPDKLESDSGDDQQPGADDLKEMLDEIPRSLKDKGKGKAVIITDLPTPVTRSVSPGKRSRDVSELGMKQGASADQTMREWIRKEHGLALQRLQLYLVPLKASVLGRAIQLHTLERITLLSVGGQGPFWQLMCKAQEDRPLALRDIHIDDVSAPFLKCVSKLEKLTALVLMRRNKQVKDNTTTKEPASIEEIRKLAVQPHIDTLNTLVIENQQDQSWCLTQVFIALLCARGNNLKLLSFQCSSGRFVEFTSSTDFFVSSSKGKHKLKLASLEAFHYLGVGINSPGVHATSTELLGANGEAHDPNHDFLARDSYKGCRTQLQLWAKRRRSYGDTALKYVAIDRNAFEIGATTTSKDVPKWLQEDYERAKAEMSQEDGPADISLTLEEWAQQKGYERWTQQRFTEIKQIRLAGMKHIRIFNKSTRYGTL